MNIRHGDIECADGIREVHLSAFDAEEASGVAELAVDMLDSSSAPDTINLVAELEGELIGHVAFSPIYLKASGEKVGCILAPLGVKEGHQKSGVGSKLVQSGIDELKIQACGLILVYGDPAYYGRFGFEAKTGELYRPPYPLEYPFGWQGLQLGEVGSEGGDIECVRALNKPELW